jgi:phenylacetate-CoA ligase
MTDQAESVTDWEAERWEKFQPVLQNISQSNRFQKSRFPELSDWESWQCMDDFSNSCALTTKEELERDQLTYPPHGTNLTFPPSRYLRFSRTSGTSGDPVNWMDTPDDWQWMLGNWGRILEEAGVQPGAKCFFAFSFGPFLGFWTAYEAAIQRGCVSIPGGGQSTESRIQTILQHKVEYLFCTPTYSMRLINTAKEQGIELKKNSLKKIIVAGECGGSLAVIREAVDQAWKGRSLIYDHYGMTEVGPVAYEIPGGVGGLRILLDSYHAEVIDPQTTEPIGDGRIGELILTPLGRTGSPVFRYRTGDLVKVRRGRDAEGVPTFDLIGGILGRADDMVIVRGVNLYPSGVDAVVRKFTEIGEYQVVIEQVREMTEVSIRAECTPEVAISLEGALEDAFSLRIPVESVPSETLPSFEMKAKRWIRKDRNSST